MLETLGLVIIMIAAVTLIVILAIGFLVLIGTTAGLDIYDHEELEETKPMTLLGVVSPRENKSSKGKSDV